MGFFCTFAAMKQVKIFHQYAWIINTLKSNKRVTFEELKRLWILDEVADGKPLYRSTFNRHREESPGRFLDPLHFSNFLSLFPSSTCIC